jgi:hypothetical protein
VRVGGPGQQQLAFGHVQRQLHWAVAHFCAHPAPLVRGLLHVE